MKRFATIVFLLAISLSAFPQGRIYQLGTGNDYAAAIKTEKFTFYAAKQDADNWCWAACIQMVLDYQGLFVEQCEIVKKAFGMSDCSNMPANCSTTKAGAEGWRIGNRIVKATIDSKADCSHLVDQLAYKNPVVVGLNMPPNSIGHAYVLTAIFFRYNSLNEKIPYKVVLRDPWPPNQSRQEFGWSDFKSRVNCITYVTL